eukprot:gnl/MRDRNA2_/MRDRNA2_84612_c0_seq3.p1 gnl/MRDRNA2_/MRDRNA2_84612_c0~~gnl/MRDRNA2_/MRDRNA2_84612_c0_seq3.p1  ORF type:complete len:368 (+),score=56.45 gnl/MRDRNA2_/MRDRNA2_84612_c0_seq3:74-1105(+)
MSSSGTHVTGSVSAAPSMALTVTRIEAISKCWGGLIAHMAAFAAIVVFGELQMVASESIGAVGVYLFPLCVLPFFLALFQLFSKIRQFLIPEDNDETISLWDLVVRDSENDVCGLCVSFLIARCVQFAIEGEETLVPEHEVHYHSRTQIGLCGVAALASVAIMIAFIFQKSEIERKVLEKSHSLFKTGIDCDRLNELGQTISAMTCAWNALNFSTWQIRGVAHRSDWTPIWTEVVEALIVSLECIVLTFLLDKLADAEKRRSVETCIRRLILTFGVLIGFCWEHCFHEGVHDIAARVHNKTEFPVWILRFVGCTGVTLIVLPAFSWYIVPKVFMLKKLHGDED